MILDEATSALDENTEKKILEAIAKTDHPTCLFVSHRRYLEKYADQVVEICSDDIEYNDDKLAAKKG